MTLGFQDIGIRIFEFVAKTQFLCKILEFMKLRDIYVLQCHSFLISEKKTTMIFRKLWNKKMTFRLKL